MPISPSAAASLALAGVCKRYGDSQEPRITAAHEVSLPVQPGSVTALTGPSGSGKSTLLHLIGAIERPDAGTITSDGTEVTACTAPRSPPTAAPWGSCSSVTTCCPRSPCWTT